MFGVNEYGTLQAKKPRKSKICEVLNFLAPRPGLEPGTYGLTVRRSTN